MTVALPEPVAVTIKLSDPWPGATLATPVLLLVAVSVGFPVSDACSVAV